MPRSKARHIKSDMKITSGQHGFQLMAIEVNKKSQNRLNLSSSSIQDQCKAYKKKYMAAKKIKNLTRDGITEEDESKGIKSMSENLESMCPCYAEMDVLLGHKPNVTPIASYDSQEKDNFNGDDDDVLLDKVSYCVRCDYETDDNITINQQYYVCSYEI
ncbi:hypothetical protein O181_009573 [Austropuccinia psidii MF-1]|uniref:Uncharacterized protein n=1 Tax=Austropuccinia psidii MF-1 TaxID=1389203 RepID=A0A9Q3BRL4_9BASI|nr:hypothetical protein [Austropuccinia psidii MF-1]